MMQVPHQTATSPGAGEARTTPEPGRNPFAVPARERLRPALGILRCPHCGEAFTQQETRLACPRGHTFDCAKQGYVNLLGAAPPPHADSADMVSARRRVHDTGFFEQVASGIAEVVASHRASRRPLAHDRAQELAQGLEQYAVAEVGAGDGYYLHRVLTHLHTLGTDRMGHGADATPGTAGLLPHVATDISVAATRRSAGRGLASIVADTWKPLPIADHSIDALLCCFAPRNLAEFARVVRPGGLIIVAAPRADHLTPLVSMLDLLSIPDDKHRQLADEMAPVARAVAVHTWTSQMEMTSEQIRDLVMMGPNAFHHTPERDAAITALGTVPVTMAVTASVFEVMETT